jgi:dihydrofolate reductase
MPKLIVFNSVSLDGYFTDATSDMSWAHNAKKDPEFDAFVQNNAKGDGILVFGRKTYELMASFWPTPQAMQMDPVVANGMNNLSKVVFSRTLDKASWKHTRVVKSDLPAEIRKIKKEPGKDLVILGSGSLVSQLTQEGLIDEYQFVMIPIVLGAGRTLFDGVKQKLPLKLTKTRPFANGNVLLHYQREA